MTSFATNVHWVVVEHLPANNPCITIMCRQKHIFTRSRSLILLQARKVPKEGFHLTENNACITITSSHKHIFAESIICYTRKNFICQKTIHVQLLRPDMNSYLLSQDHLLHVLHNRCRIQTDCVSHLLMIEGHCQNIKQNIGNTYNNEN